MRTITATPDQTYTDPNGEVWNLRVLQTAAYAMRNGAGAMIAPAMQDAVRAAGLL